MIYIILIEFILVTTILSYFFGTIGYNNNIVLLLTYGSTYLVTHCLLLILIFIVCGLLVRLNNVIILIDDLFSLKDGAQVRIVINESYHMNILNKVSSMYSEMLKVSKFLNFVY